MDFKELLELIRILEESGLSEIEVEEEGRRIRLQKPAPPAVLQSIAMVPGVAPAAQAPGLADPSAAETEEAPGLPTIDAPMVGTFYSSPAPGEESFIQVGDTVEENQTVCIVEAMKLMNEVTSKLAGVVEKILVENGQPVEFGQPLFAIRTTE